MPKEQLDNAAEPKLTPSELFEAGKIFIKARMPFIVSGSPGQGKSSIIEQICESLKVDLIISHPIVDNPVDYKGFPALVGTAKSKKATFLPYGDLQRLVNAKKPTVHFADDLGQAAKMVQAAYGQLLLNRAINGHKISDNVTFVAATNRRQDKAGVQGIISMLMDRYDCHWELINSLEDWVRWAIQPEDPKDSKDSKNESIITHEVISYVRYRPEVLNAFKPTADLSRTPTPRALHSVSKMIKNGLPQHLQMRSFAGAIGIERAVEFTGFLRIYQNLPDPDAILMDPKNGEVPEDPGPLYALCGALAARATENTIERIITYANKLEDEFSVLLVKDATNRDKTKLCKNSAFTNWAVNHQDVLS